jgi:hypothetical protein
MREASAIIVGSQQVKSLHRCCHCQAHFEMVPGSGRTRGFCMRCGAVHCGAPACMECVPFEARLEHAEGKRTSYDDTIRELVAKGAVLL